MTCIIKAIDEIKLDSLMLIKKIVVIDAQTKEKIKFFVEVEKIINIMLNCSKTIGIVTTEKNNWDLLCYDSCNHLIFTILVWKTGHIGFNTKEYVLSSIDRALFLKNFEKDYLN